MTSLPQPITTVTLASLLVEPRFQIRRALDPGTVNKYANLYTAGQPMSPIKVAMLAGAAVLVDGFHRVAALRANGQQDVEAFVVTVENEEEALWLAAQANLTHGLPLKASEHRRVFQAYVRAGNHRRGRGFKSYREIAGTLEIGRAYSTIRNWMRKDFPSVALQMNGGDDFKGTGGLPDAKPRFYADAQAGLNQLLAASNGVSPEERGWLIRDMNEALQRLTTAAPWQPASVTEDF